ATPACEFALMLSVERPTDSPWLRTFVRLGEFAQNSPSSSNTSLIHCVQLHRSSSKTLLAWVVIASTCILEQTARVTSILVLGRSRSLSAHSFQSASRTCSRAARIWALAILQTEHFECTPSSGVSEKRLGCSQLFAFNMRFDRER